MRLRFDPGHKCRFTASRVVVQVRAGDFSPAVRLEWRTDIRSRAPQAHREIGWPKSAARIHPGGAHRRWRDLHPSDRTATGRQELDRVIRQRGTHTGAPEVWLDPQASKPGRFRLDHGKHGAHRAVISDLGSPRRRGILTPPANSARRQRQVGSAGCRNCSAIGRPISRAQQVSRRFCVIVAHWTHVHRRVWIRVSHDRIRQASLRQPLSVSRNELPRP